MRTYPTPEAARDAILASAAVSFDQLEFAAQCGNQWAQKVISKENGRLLDRLLDGNPVLPKGVLAAGDDDDVVVALFRSGMAWRGSGTGWLPVDDSGLRAATLTADDVAFIARAFDDGCDSVVLRPVLPLAFLTAAGDDPGASADVPEGARVVAVVDELDKNAVMDLVAVLPGPKVLRRHDGSWREDPQWLTILRSVKPPPIVPLEDGKLIASVAAQIDQQTSGQEWVDTDTDDYLNASAWARADEMAFELALVAAPKKGHVGKSAAERGKAAARRAKGGSGMPPELRRYWQHGKGAAKIRWGTPGAMRRCARNIRKYVGPHRAYQTCNNLSKALGGKGVAWDVG